MGKVINLFEDDFKNCSYTKGEGEMLGVATKDDLLE